MIGHRKIWLMLTVATLLAGAAVAMAAATPGDRPDPDRPPAELLLFYSNDVQGEIEPCG